MVGEKHVAMSLHSAMEKRGIRVSPDHPPINDRMPVYSKSEWACFYSQAEFRHV
jgi:hypothetical protein